MIDILKLVTSGTNEYGGLVGTKFYSFLDVCFEKSTFFSLRVLPSCVHPIVDELNPYLYKKTLVNKWFGYYPIAYSEIPIHVFYADEQAKKHLCHYFVNVFLETEEGERVGADDLAFFVDKQMIVGTLSHENICEVMATGDWFETCIKNLAAWKFRPQCAGCGMEYIQIE